RVGEGSRIAFIELGDKKVVGMDDGHAYLRVASELSPDKGFVLTFPTGQLTVVGKALARLDVSEDGSAELRVMRGDIELQTTTETAKLVRAGERVLVNSQGWTDFTTLDFARTDAFDAWNEERDIALSTYRRPAYVEEDIVGVEELDGYGEWVYVDRYDTYAWHPYVVEDWRPYCYGRWYYGRYYGWTWIPEEPWGYVTYHYGSWNYDPYYGWVWVPGYVWRPAYVHWLAYGDYIGWVPIGYYGYPVITTYPYYVTHTHFSYIDTFSFTFSFWFDFHGHHDHHYAHHRHDHHDHHGRHDGHHGNVDGDHNKVHKDHPQVRQDFKKLVLTDGRTVDIGKIEPAKLRTIKNIENERLEKGVRKGRVARRDLDHGKFLDVDKHPEMRKKLAKLSERRARTAKLHAGSVSEGLPKKIKKDRVEALDFRRGVKVKEKARTEGRNAPNKIDKARPINVSDKRVAAATGRNKFPNTDGNITSNNRKGRSVSVADRAAQQGRLDNSGTGRSAAISRPVDTLRGQKRSIPPLPSTNQRPAMRKVASDNMKRTTAGTEPKTARLANNPKSYSYQNMDRPPQQRGRVSPAVSRTKRNNVITNDTPTPIRQERHRVNELPRVQTQGAKVVPSRVDRSGSSTGHQQRIVMSARGGEVARQGAVGTGHGLRSANAKTFANSRTAVSNRFNDSGRRPVNASPRFGGRRR
ncbi:MAG: hypothetical protein JSV16_02580, partial [Candidatus Hydrogenedentota bacterium]